MATYTLVIGLPAGGPREVKSYSTATNAIDDMENWRAGGATVSIILRDDLPIDEAELRDDEGLAQMIDAARPHAGPGTFAGRDCGAGHHCTTSWTH